MVARSEIEVFLNPAHGEIHVGSSSADLPLVFSLYDLNGCLLMQKDIITTDQSISPDPRLKGVYVYQLWNNRFVRSGRIILE
jgi:hypothetical protein